MLKEISSLQHPLVKHLVKLRKNSDYRHEHSSVLIEGVKFVSEICQTLQPKTLLACDETLIPKKLKAENVIIVSEDILRKISGLKAPEGVLAEVPLPKMDSLQNKKYIIALDRVSDPGNMGTLLRTALALGWEGVFILEDSCDPFNEKALRAARGATFRLPLAIGNWITLQEIIKKNKLHPLVADLHGKKLNTEISKEGILLVLSNEAHGLSSEAKEICEKITIPMPGPMESLNVSVAGGILMHALKPV
jgi:RNA methyltransferase, TrmH family